MLSSRPGSLGEYAPGKESRLGRAVPVPPVTLTWEHER